MKDLVRKSMPKDCVYEKIRACIQPIFINSISAKHVQIEFEGSAKSVHFTSRTDISFLCSQKEICL